MVRAMNASILRRNRLFAGVLAAVFATGAVAGVATPVAADPPAVAASSSKHSPVKYVALGDSYAAGQGAAGPGDFVCERTRLAYPSLLDLLPKIKLVKNAACTGATTQTVLNTQLGDLRKSTRLVTLTVGVNDLGLVQLVGACSADPTSAVCQAGVPALTSEVQKALAGNQDNVFSRAGASVAALLQRIRSLAPRAKIVVTGYPRPLEPNASNSLVTLVNTGTDVLNGALARAVPASGVRKAVFVDVTRLFKGHGVGSSRPWLITSGPDAFHPNLAGQAAYAFAIGKVALR
jgi:lysophospholipase L1-like esterase